MGAAKSHQPSDMESSPSNQLDCIPSSPIRFKILKGDKETKVNICKMVTEDDWTKVSLCKYFWENGKCVNSEKSCKFNHQIPEHMDLSFCTDFLQSKCSGVSSKYKYIAGK